VRLVGTLPEQDVAIGLPNEAAPRILHKSWTLTADIEVPEAGAGGMNATHGGLVGGYGLYVRDGKPTFVYNYLALDRFTFAGKEPLPKGKVQLKSTLPKWRRRIRQGRGRDHDGERHPGRRRLAAEDHSDPDFARRRARHRHGCRLGHGFHL
jgi:hypothetical protein